MKKQVSSATGYSYHIYYQLSKRFWYLYSIHWILGIHKNIYFTIIIYYLIKNKIIINICKAYIYIYIKKVMFKSDLKLSLIISVSY